jgi:hypothetical protein
MQFHSTEASLPGVLFKRVIDDETTVVATPILPKIPPKELIPSPPNIQAVPSLLVTDPAFDRGVRSPIPFNKVKIPGESSTKRKTMPIFPVEDFPDMKFSPCASNHAAFGILHAGNAVVDGALGVKSVPPQLRVFSPPTQFQLVLEIL